MARSGWASCDARRWARALAGALLAAVAVAVARLGAPRAHALVRMAREGAFSKLLIEADELLCGLIEEDYSFVGIPVLGLANATSAEDCCTLCQSNPLCRAWTHDADNVCHVMRMSPGQVPTKVSSPGTIAGVPFLPDVHALSMFCFALVIPDSYEKSLMSLQHRLRQGIFACNEYDAYSNQSFTLAEGVNTSIVDHDLTCENGGEFSTALNNAIFMAVWGKVISDGRFRYHDWTVKVDPDTVFFPGRLRVALASHSPPEGGMYLNNCQFGLHGPIEVLSRHAVLSWAAGAAKCSQYFNKLCSGDCYWGEDMFLDQCLSKVLNVTRKDEFKLLSEKHCDDTDWKECKNGNIAFHPFKTTEEYRTCLASADYGALPD